MFFIYCWTCCLIPLISELRRLRQEDCNKLQATPCYRVRLFHDRKKPKSQADRQADDFGDGSRNEVLLLKVQGLEFGFWHIKPWWACNPLRGTLGACRLSDWTTAIEVLGSVKDDCLCLKMVENQRRHQSSTSVLHIHTSVCTHTRERTHTSCTHVQTTWTYTCKHVMIY